MRKFHWFLVVAAAVVWSASGGCVAGKPGRVSLAEQQALVRGLSDKCAAGVRVACARIEDEKRVLFEVYGCHCKDSQPPDHKVVW